MNNLYKLCFILMIAVVQYGHVLAQQKDSINVGKVTGVLRDSTHNYVMRSATVSIYKVEDEKLVSYQLSNNFGRFQFANIPIGIPLRIVATNIGYIPSKVEFLVPARTREIHLKTLNMEQGSILLNDVTISASPPMQMRGDTLEFNAAAFKLDTNAVVEDMLRRLPGITVWSDGLITVNGKKIKKLLVDGKEFFGGDPKIALQNLPKNIVEKVQVYEDKRNPDPVDPSTNMNIVLKKDKKNGYFGKLGGGYGTDKHYDADGMVSYYSEKTQLSVVGALNDVNKAANSVNALISLNSYKGAGIKNDYYSDFTKPGLNVFNAAGFNVTHDFATYKKYLKKEHLLNADYFLLNTRSEVNQQTQTLITLASNDRLEQAWINNETNKNFGKKWGSSYKKDYEHSRINANYYHQKNVIEIDREQKGTSVSSLDSIASQTVNLLNSLKNQDIIKGSINLVTNKYKEAKTGNIKLLDMELKYLFDLNDSNEENKRITNFTTSDIDQNKYINRHYLLNVTKSGHTVISQFNNVTGLSQIETPFIRVDLRNSISINKEREINEVSDALYNSDYTPNRTLSNTTETKIVNYKPGLNFSKNIVNSLDTRYSKALKINIFTSGDFYIQKNISQKDFQNLERSYFYLTPSANIVYSDFQFGGSRQSYSLNYNTSIIYPTVRQLAPLVDDVNVYNIYQGNINLKASYKHQVFLHYDYDNGKAKNPLLTDINISFGITENFISDSSFYDVLGRNIHFPINVSHNKYATFKGYFQKAYKLRHNQFQLSVNSEVNYSHYPSSFNGRYYITKANSFTLLTDLVYSYKGWLTTNIGETYSGNNTVQANLSNYSYSNWKTYSNIVFALPKSLFFGTRIDFNTSKSSYTNNIYYTIWNLDLGYRFLKGANAEIKLSALDLLRQNKNVINRIGINHITTGTLNVLQQYFIVKLSYYPRKFGLNKK